MKILVFVCPLSTSHCQVKCLVPAEYCTVLVVTTVFISLLVFLKSWSPLEGGN